MKYLYKEKLKHYHKSNLHISDMEFVAVVFLIGFVSLDAYQWGMI
jgi:hypothetical protein